MPDVHEPPAARVASAPNEAGVPHLSDLFPNGICTVRTSP